tara:strand:- start:635 stop:736 length:102 start_codon:yes stop_codon:yes gene_type:complete
MGLLSKIWKFMTSDEGMTWERYHRNMEKKRNRK